MEIQGEITSSDSGSLGFSNSQSSPVLSTLTLSCFLSSSSSDQMQSDLNLSARAKYSISLACGEVSLASPNLSRNFSRGTKSILNLSTPINASKSSCEKPDLDIMSALFFSNSASSLYGAESFASSEKNISNVLAFQPLPLEITAEKSSLASGTTFIYAKSSLLSCLSMPSLTFLPSSKADSFVSLLLDDNASITALCKALDLEICDSKTFNLIDSSAISDQSIGNSSISLSNSSGILIFNSGILISQMKHIQNQYLNVAKNNPDYSTIPISKFSEICPALDCGVVDYITSKKKIKDVKENDYVLSLDESSGKLKPSRVKALVDHGIKPIYEMTTEDGRAINTTAEHPYLVKLYDKKLCDKLSGDVWNKDRKNALNENSIAEKSVGEKNSNEINSIEDEFEQKGYCTRWVEVRYLEEGMEIAVPSIEGFYSALESEVSSGAGLSLGSSSSFNNSAVVKTLTLDCSLNAASSDQIGKLNAKASAKYGSSFVPLPCGEILLASGRNFSYSLFLNSPRSLLSSDITSSNSSSLIFANFMISGLLPDSSFDTKSGEDNLHSCSSSLLNTSLLEELTLKNENRIEASAIKFSGISEGICSHKPCLLATLFFNSSPSLDANSSVISLFFNISSNLLNASSLLRLLRNDSLATSDQFTHEKCSISALRESGSDAITLAIYNSHLCSSSNFLSNSTLLANAFLITSAQFISGCLSNLAFNSSGIDTVNVAILIPSYNSMDKQKSVEIYKSFGLDNYSAFVGNSSYYVSKDGEWITQIRPNYNKISEFAGLKIGGLKSEVLNRQFSIRAVLEQNLSRAVAEQWDKDFGIDRSQISEQGMMALGLDFQNYRTRISELMGQEFQNKMALDLGRDFQNWKMGK